MVMSIDRMHCWTDLRSAVLENVVWIKLRHPISMDPLCYYNAPSISLSRTTIVRSASSEAMRAMLARIASEDVLHNENTRLL